MQPEDFKYDFRDWVSPYTKGAHTSESLAFVLQDWSSEDALRRDIAMRGGIDPSIQEFGRSLHLLTNTRLEKLLDHFFGYQLADVYATNIFPFVKRGNISSSISMRDARAAAFSFIKPELQIAKPKKVLALGRLPSILLKEIGIDCINLPHPAARIGGLEAHVSRWNQALREFPDLLGPNAKSADS
jgi:hypothetical protein